MTEQIADRFMQQGDYYAAAKFYSRVYFFSGKSELGRISGKLGQAYFAKGDFERAYNHLEQAQKLEQNDSLKTEWFLQKTAALALQHKYKLALLEMLNYRGKFTGEQKRKLHFIKGTVYFGEEKFEKAKESFKSAIDKKDTIALKRLDELFAKKNIMRPNPKTAKWLSIFMPGSGQIYAGDLKNGINSLVLNGSLFYLFVRDAARFSFWESFIVFYPWIQRYYQGGYERAERIAVERRKQKRARIYRNVHELIWKN
jgi:tetratricopeptide (TPR) repeat protein